MHRQEQTAGERSQQFQAKGNMTITVTGVSAADVVEITQAEISRIRDELTSVANAVAEARLQTFEDRILAEFAEAPQLREAFADPDFQFSLRDAGRAAVSNDDQHTEDLLVDLLKNRAEQGNHARVRLATSHAIRAADKLSLEALNGLTAVWALGSLGAAEPGINNEFAARAGIATRLLALGLPDGRGWVEDADALNLVRMSAGGLVVTRKPYRQLFTERVSSQLNTGIDLEASRGLIEAATSTCPWLAQKLQPHALKPNFVVLAGSTQEGFLAELPAGSERPAELDQLIAQNAFGTQDPAAIDAFNRRFDDIDALSKIAEWWDQVPPVSFTVIGTVIGFVNTRRYVQFGGVQTVAELLAQSTA